MSAEQHSKIVIVTGALSAGGTERVAAHLAKWLEEAGHDVCLLTFSATDTDFYQTPAGVSRIGLDLLRPSRNALEALYNNWRRLVALRRIVRTRNAEVVIALGEQTNVAMLLALTGVRCRKIISERSDPFLYKRPMIWRVLRRFTYAGATLHVAQSKQVARWMQQHFPQVPNAIIGNSFGRAPKGQRRHVAAAREPVLRLVAVSRLSREKGIDLLLDAFAMARQRVASLELHIAGEGVERATLERQAQTLGLERSVSFLGNVSDVHSVLLNGDIFILPSRFEGFPNAMIEAMAAGLPVIAARCPGGIEDILGNVAERYALEFPPGDAPSLAAAIDRLAGSPELRATLAASALRRSADYSPEMISAAWLAAVAYTGTLRSRFTADEGMRDSLPIHPTA